MDKFKTAIEDLVKQGVTESDARAMLTAPGSPFGPAVERGAANPDIGVPHVAITRVHCATHVDGNCPSSACPDRIRPNLSATDAEHYRIEREKAEAEHEATEERFRVAMSRLGIDAR